jgi:hypothetical protein
MSRTAGDLLFVATWPQQHQNQSHDCNHNTASGDGVTFMGGRLTPMGLTLADFANPYGQIREDFPNPNSWRGLLT